MMRYNRCGRSGLLLPALTLGLWHNFGDEAGDEACVRLIAAAFDHGITHFDLADNYGPPPGSAESRFGACFERHFKAHRDEVVVATKAGHLMWPGPYGDWGSRKHLLAGLDQSLRRLRLEYVDIFYHHRPDPETPLEESLGALATAVRSGKALYAGISKYSPEATIRAAAFFREERIPFIVHQARYNMFNREIEASLLPAAAREGLGVVAFSALAQGLLTDKYLGGIPEGSRIAKGSPFLTSEALTAERLDRIRRLDAFARARGQTLSRLAVAWVLRRPEITTALIGASRPEHIRENCAALADPPLDDSALAAIDAILA